MFKRASVSLAVFVALSALQSCRDESANISAPDILEYKSLFWGASIDEVNAAYPEGERSENYLLVVTPTEKSAGHQHPFTTIVEFGFHKGKLVQVNESSRIILKVDSERHFGKFKAKYSSLVSAYGAPDREPKDWRNSSSEAIRIEWRTPKTRVVARCCSSVLTKYNSLEYFEAYGELPSF